MALTCLFQYPKWPGVGNSTSQGNCSSGSCSHQSCLLAQYHYVSPFRLSEAPGGHTSNIYNVYMCTDGAENRTKLPSLTMFHSVWQYTVFLQSDATATIYFAAHFVQLLFEGGVYFSFFRHHKSFVHVCAAFTSCGYTIRGRHLFRSRASDFAVTIPGRPLFKGGVYSKKYSSTKIYIYYIIHDT